MQAISIDQSITRTAYDTCFYGDRKTPCQVEIHPDSGVKLNDTVISLDDLRYASKQQYKGFPDRAAHCVVLSYNDQAERDVNHHFLEMDTLDDTSELLEDFLKLFKSKFLVMEQENDSSIDKDCYGIIVDQPIYFGEVDIKVSEMEGDATVVYEGRSIVVLDIECLTLYPVVNNKLGTPYRLMFWQDEGPHSVEKILHYHKEQKIAFSTTSHTYEMVCYY